MIDVWWMRTWGRRALGTGLVLALGLLPARALSAMTWDFRERGTPSWQAGGDVAALERTAEGLRVVPSGPGPTITATGLSVPARDVAFIRLRVRAAAAIDQGAVGWLVTVPEGDTVQIKQYFSVPKPLHGGRVRTVWIRLDEETYRPAGTVTHVGLVMDVGRDPRPIVIEAIELRGRGARSEWGLMFSALDIDGVAEDLVFPLSSLNSVRPLSFGATTLGSVAALVTVVALILVGVSRLRSLPASLANGIRRSGGVLLFVVVVGIGVADTVIEALAFHVERTVFGGKDSSDDQRYLDGFDLVGVASELRGLYPPGTLIDICYWGNDASRTILSHRLRYELIPLKVTPGATLIAEFDRGRTECGESDRVLSASGDGFRVYQQP